MTSYFGVEFGGILRCFRRDRVPASIAEPGRVEDAEDAEDDNSGG